MRIVGIQVVYIRRNSPGNYVILARVANSPTIQNNQERFLSIRVIRGGMCTRNENKDT